MNNHQPQDMFFDQAASRSPGSQRHQQQSLHRQTSRQFDAYGQMPNPLFMTEDQGQRYPPSRFDNLSSNLPSGGYGYDMNATQTWNPNAFSNSQTFNAFGANARMKPNIRSGRSALPNAWLDQQAAPPMPSMNTFGSMGPPSMPTHPHPLRNDTFLPEPEEELIPTAIVIKNIPFAVKKEQLQELMTHMNLPLPYAFNYHFDNGVFRGLAFANFTSAEETATVIDHLNHYELHGRKLRVEYKKMLPIQERERIEREKRERRGQLEEQHRPMATPGLQNQHSMSSLTSHIPATSPSPVSARNSKPEVDLNDPQTLQFYSQILLFKDDQSREALIFPSTLTPHQRRIVHTLAHLMQLAHVSRGNGDQRQVHVLRAGHGSNMSPPLLHSAAMHSDHSKRVLNRSATTEFGEARGSDPAMYGTLRGHQSSGYLGIPDSPSGYVAQQNLRGAKSFADLRSFTPSPVPSSASFPPTWQSQIARFQDGGVGAGAGAGSSASNATPTLTPTASGNTLGQQRDESFLVNGLSGMSIGSGIGPNNGGSPRRLRGMFSWDDNQNQGPPTAPIGSNRNFSMGNFDDSSRDRNSALPLRQPRGPVGERAPGFSRGRQNGHQARGSDELRQQSSSVEIIVE